MAEGMVNKKISEEKVINFYGTYAGYSISCFIMHMFYEIEINILNVYGLML